MSTFIAKRRLTRLPQPKRYGLYVAPETLNDTLLATIAANPKRVIIDAGLSKRGRGYYMQTSHSLTDDANTGEAVTVHGTTARNKHD